MTRISNIELWINKICNSKVFTSPTDSRLLRYLADATINGNVLKESVIAVDIFNRDPSFNPGDDSIVRSSIYNLRKKLDSYYLEDGKDDLIRITIPKGSYRVVFEEVQPGTIRIGKTKKIIRKSDFGVLIILLVVTTSVFSILYFSQRRTMLKLKKTSENNYFWSDFIKSDKPLLIVLGNYFMMERIHPSDSSHSFIRNPAVNTPEEFLAFRDQNPELKEQMKTFGMSYFGEEIPWCLMKIIEVFNGTSKKIDLKYSSELVLNDLREKDIVFFGDFSTINILKSFLNQTHYKFKISPPTIYYLENNIDTAEIISIVNPSGTDFQNDYSIIAKINGYKDNKIMLFLSFSPFGKTEAIYKLTDPSFIDELNKISIERPVYWDMLFKVSGLGTSGFYYEILRFKPLGN